MTVEITTQAHPVIDVVVPPLLPVVGVTTLPQVNLDVIGLPGEPGPPGPPGPAGDSMTMFEYIYNSSSPPPVGSQLRMNTSVQTAVTSIFITKNTSLGIDPTLVIRLIDDSYRITIQDKNDSTKYQRYNVNGTPTEFSTYFQIPVVWTDGGDPLIEQAVKFVIISVGTVIYVGPTPPDDPALNALWVDTS
jgi:hypothetical protein